MLMRSATAMLVLLAAIGLAAEVCAQIPGGQGGAGGPGGSRGGMGAGRGGPPPEPVRSGSAQEAPLSPGALVQIQLDQLEDDLRLTPAQVGAWTTYADRVQKLADDTARSRFDARLSTPAPTSAVQQLDQIAGAMHGRMSAVDEIVDSGRTLYAMLTPEQRVIADRRLSLVVTLLATGVTPAGMMDNSASRSARRPRP